MKKLSLLLLAAISVSLYAGNPIFEDEGYEFPHQEGYSSGEEGYSSGEEEMVALAKKPFDESYMDKKVSKREAKKMARASKKAAPKAPQQKLAAHTPKHTASKKASK